MKTGSLQKIEIDLTEGNYGPWCIGPWDTHISALKTAVQAVVDSRHTIRTEPFYENAYRFMTALDDRQFPSEEVAWLRANTPTEIRLNWYTWLAIARSLKSRSLWLRRDLGTFPTNWEGHWNGFGKLSAFHNMKWHWWDRGAGQNETTRLKLRDGQHPIWYGAPFAPAPMPTPAPRRAAAADDASAAAADTDCFNEITRLLSELDDAHALVSELREQIKRMYILRDLDAAADQRKYDELIEFAQMVELRNDSLNTWLVSADDALTSEQQHHGETLAALSEANTRIKFLQKWNDQLRARVDALELSEKYYAENCDCPPDGVATDDSNEG